jgi:hypothetical protein
MTRTELKPLYVEAATRARVKPNSSEEAVWMSQIGHADIRDLKAAIDAHFTRSTWMPKESELRPLVEQARQSRIARNRAPHQLSAWKCCNCGAGVTSFQPGFTPKSCAGVYRGPDRGGDANAPCGSTRFELRLREPLAVASQLLRTDVARIQPGQDRTTAANFNHAA